MKNTVEILDIEQIIILVDNFYTKIRKDELLKDIFENVIQDRWPEHLEKMYKFWQTILLDERMYSGQPFPPHANLPVEKEHFDRWLILFEETLCEHFHGKAVNVAKWQANRMAEMFQIKINYFRQNLQQKPVL